MKYNSNQKAEQAEEHFCVSAGTAESLIAVGNICKMRIFTDCR
jgi:hypothetical protein